jgi:hypothetical protein
MKYVKMLGLAAVAAAALMAFVGATSASATVLCKTNPTAGAGETTGTVCPSGQAYGTKEPSTGVAIHAVNTGTVKLDTSFKTIECTGSTLGGETNAEEGSPLTGPEGTLTFTGCNCTVTVLKAGTVSIEWISGTHNGTVTSSGNETTTSCKTIFGTVHCIYVTSGTHVGTLTGGNPATLSASATIPVDAEHSNGLCPQESKWTASYEVTTPKPLFVAGHT